VKREEAPVVPGRLYGLRAWTVTGGARLGSLAQQGSWAKGSKATKARCAAGRGHRAPAGDCGCGLYALHPTVAQCQSSFAKARRAARAGGTSGDVFGIVAAWGEVELHESGFRAEYARPHALLLPAGAGDGYTRRVRALAAGHDAEVWEVDSGHRLHRRCVEENLGLSEVAVNELLGAELRRQVRRDRLRRRGDAVIELGAAAIGLVISGLFWGLIPLVVVVSLLSEDGDDPAPAKTPASKLQILEHRLIERDGSDFYVALVRNPSRSRSALQVHPKGAFLDEFGDPIAWPDRPANTDNRPSLAPGQVGVVWDWLDSYESVANEVKRFRVRFVASRWVAGRRSPIGVSRPRLRRPICLVTARVRSAGGESTPRWRSSSATAAARLPVPAPGSWARCREAGPAGFWSGSSRGPACAGGSSSRPTRIWTRMTCSVNLGVARLRGRRPSLTHRADSRPRA
jgi:hypothetical protein